MKTFFSTAFVAIMHRERLSHLQTANTSAHNEVKNGKRFFLPFFFFSFHLSFFVGDSNIMMMGLKKSGAGVKRKANKKAGYKKCVVEVKVQGVGHFGLV